jgi:hypothetical protein
LKLTNDLGQLGEWRGWLDEEAIAAKPGFGELAVTGEEDSPLSGCLGQDGPSLGPSEPGGRHVIPQNAEPACQSLQHGVSQERRLKEWRGGGSLLGDGM